MEAQDRLRMQKTFEKPSNANRAGGLRFLMKKEAERISVNTLRHYATALGFLDRCSKGKPWKGITPDQSCQSLRD